jgi:4-hydroxybenzoate polyprenyltransferase
VKYNLKGLLFWNNHFYGICAIFLATASSITLLHKIPSFPILSLIYFLTVFYYTWAYLHSYKNEDVNERTQWYQQHAFYLKIRQGILLFVMAYLAFFVLNIFQLFIQAVPVVKYLFVFTGTISIFYYSPLFLNTIGFRIRENGFLKSFTIAWVWTVICCLLSIWLVTKSSFLIQINISHFWAYFFQLFVFIFILAMLFDIKDVNRDRDRQLNTIVVKYGLMPTFTKLLIPLLLIYAGMSAYLCYCLNLGPWYLLGEVLLAIIVYLIAQRVIHEKLIYRNILLIDGLMLLKAILGFILI